MQIRMALALLTVLAAGAQPDPLARWQGGGRRPGIAVVVVRDGRVEFQRTLGYADLQAGRPVRGNTRFLAGSISKQFTARAVMVLAAEGKVGLDEPVGRYVPETPEYAKAVTVRQLLHHTGGLPDHEELLAGKVEGAYFSSSRGPRLPAPYGVKDAFAALGRAPGARFAPGEKWEYSNTGYLLLGQLIERVCGCTYAEFLAARFFRPLGMKDTMVMPPVWTAIPRLALAYTRRDGKWADISYSPLNFMVGHDGVITTVEDMVRWAGSWDGPAVAEAFQSGRTNDGRPTGYGFAWHLKDLDGEPVAQHEGCWAGYRNAIVRVPGKKLTVIVLTNAADGAEFWNCDDSVKLARELARR